MLKISRESEINLINVLIDHDIISGKDLPNIKKLSSEGKKSQIDAVFELKLTDENKILDVLVKEQNLEVVDLTKAQISDEIKTVLPEIEEAVGNFNQLKPLFENLGKLSELLSVLTDPFGSNG